ncbi:MAG TPA: glycosyltransferase family 39 protein [Pyrinomonadaceae bacterium]
MPVPLPRSRSSGPAIVLGLAVAKLAFHLLTANRYGIFRDELYYLACSEHLDWGYVDQPPLIGLVTWLVRNVLGESLMALRLLPAIAGAALVWLTGKLTRDMGGGPFAQSLAALAVLVAPVFLLMSHWLTMNAFEPLIWLGCVWCVVRVINHGQSRYWFWFGVLAGIGMQTKYTVAFLILGVIVGLLVTPQRRELRSGWIWLGALVAFLIFLPNLVWLIRHDFPFLELMSNIRASGRDVARNPLAFIVDQAMLMNPILFPLWVAGIAWLLFSRDGSRYRLLAWAYLTMLVMFIALKGKNYYLAPAYPMLLASGAIAFSKITRVTSDADSPSVRFTGRFWLRTACIVLVLIAGFVFAPLTAPILPVETFIRYQKALGIEPPKAEHQDTGPLPQYFADEFGWEDMTREVARVFNSLTPEERSRTAIFANSYGQAGAIDFFGPRYGLPKSISNHQNYWYWGPRNYEGDIVIVLGSDGRGDREHFRSVEAVGRTFHPYSRRDEHFDIFLCRGLTSKLSDVWPTMKNWR